VKSQNDLNFSNRSKKTVTQYFVESISLLISSSVKEKVKTEKCGSFEMRRGN
jgi:hypothetical protein